MILVLTPVQSNFTFSPDKSFPYLIVPTLLRPRRFNSDSLNGSLFISPPQNWSNEPCSPAMQFRTFLASNRVLETVVLSEYKRISDFLSMLFSIMFIASCAVFESTCAVVTTRRPKRFVRDCA